MSSTAFRGAALVAVAAILGFVVLSMGADDVADGSTVCVTAGEETVTVSCLSVDEAGTAAPPATVPAPAPAATAPPPASPAASPDPAPAPAPDAVTPPAPAPPAAPPAVGETASANAPGDVLVMVANGTSVSGLAGTRTNALTQQGYNTRRATNAAENVASSAIYYEAGFAADAEAIRAVFATNTLTLPMPDPRPEVLNGDVATVNVLVIIGDDDLATG